MPVRSSIRERTTTVSRSWGASLFVDSDRLSAASRGASAGFSGDASSWPVAGPEGVVDPSAQAGTAKRPRMARKAPASRKPRRDLRRDPRQDPLTAPNREKKAFESHPLGIFRPYSFTWVYSP